MSKQKATWANRIIGYGEESADQLLANEANWRIHPKNQQDALSGVLREVGVVQNIIVNKRLSEDWPVGKRGVETVLDGHLRTSLGISAGQKMPITYVDLTPAEEALVLATIDPLSAMAAADKEQLDALLRSVATEDAAVMAMLAELAKRVGIAPADDGLSKEQARQTLAERFIVPPFSVLDARQGYWQERKRAWLALGIESELGRGEATRPGSPGDTRPAVTRDGKYSGGDAFMYAGTNRSDHRSPNAIPGGLRRPAESLGPDGRTVRGDGKGRPLERERERESSAEDGDAQRPDAAQGPVRRGFARCFGQDLMRGEHIVGS